VTVASSASTARIGLALKHTRTYRTNIKEACISRANQKNAKKVTKMAFSTKDQVQAAIENYIADLAQPLRALNQQVSVHIGRAFW
jgi:hypothetical protein